MRRGNEIFIKILDIKSLGKRRHGRWASLGDNIKTGSTGISKVSVTDPFGSQTAFMDMVTKPWVLNQSYKTV